MFRPLPRRLIAALLFVAPALVFPRWWCGRDAADWYAGKLETQAALAREVAAWVEGGVDRSDFRTGHPQYDGEWAFGTYQMAALGFVQVIRAHPEMRDEFLPALEAFGPDFILISAGFDAHRDDPLAGLQFTEHGYAKATELLRHLSERFCPGRIVSVLEGGYHLRALSASVESHLRVLLDG